MEPLARRLASPREALRPDRPVPVALVITDLDVGGAEKALVALATGLDRLRWTPTVVCLGGVGALVEPLRTAGIAVTCLDARRERPARAVVRLAGVLRSIRPALVQGFLFHANVASRLAAPLAGRPWVVGGLRVAERGKAWHRTLDRLTQGLAAGSVCVSRGVERFAREVGRLDPDRLTVIPNGIDPAPFDRVEPVSRSALGVPEGAHLALFVGRLEPQKGVPVLLDAAEVVARSRPSWRLALAGEGPDAPGLRERGASSSLLRDRVLWLGRRGDVPGLLKAADVLVLPSLWEGMPNAVLEAMAARRGVVATAVEGSEDLVIPGLTGWLVPPGDATALASALGEAADDPGRLVRFGAAGRGRVEREFTGAAVVAAYDRLWSGILGFAEDGLKPEGSGDRSG